MRKHERGWRVGAVLVLCLGLGSLCFPAQVRQFGCDLAEGRNVTEALAHTVVSAYIEKPQARW